MKNENYTASSCAVDNHKGDLRLSLSFWHIGEYSDAQKHFQHERNKEMFRIDESSRMGSHMVVLLGRDFARVAAEELDAFQIRRDITYVNGSRTPCESIAQAIGMALDHP